MTLQYLEHDGYTEYTLDSASMEINGDWYYGQLSICNNKGADAVLFYKRDDDGNVSILAKDEQKVVYTFDDCEDGWDNFARLVLTA